MERGIGERIMVVALVMTSERPRVRMSWASISRLGSPPPVTRARKARCTSRPSTKKGGMLSRAPSSGSMPSATA